MWKTRTLNNGPTPGGEAANAQRAVIRRLIVDFITSFQCVCRGFQAPALDIYFIIRRIPDNAESS